MTYSEEIVVWGTAKAMAAPLLNIECHSPDVPYKPGVDDLYQAMYPAKIVLK